jgi:hypothetical protein
VTGSQETMLEPSLRGDYSNPEEPAISELGAEALRPTNSPITDLLAPILVSVVPLRVTPYER